MSSSENNPYISVATVRDRVTNRLLLVFLVAIWIALAISLLRIPLIGFGALVFSHIGIALTMAVLFLVRKKIQIQIMAYLIISLMYLLFLSGIAALGLLSGGIVLAPFISLYLMLLGRRHLALASIAINVVVLGTAGYLFLRGFIKLPFVPGDYINSLFAWLLMIIAVGGISISFVIPFGFVAGALEGSEERFRLAFENANVGICITGSEGRLVRVNDAFCTMLGYSRDELEHMTFSEITHPDDLGASFDFVKNAQTGGEQRIVFDKQYVHKDGHIIWANVSSSIFRDPNDQQQYFITHIQDVTDHKKAEEELRQSEANYKALVENTSDIIAVFDRDYRCMFINSSVSKVSNLKPHEFIGKRMRAFGFSEDQASFRENALGTVFATRQPFESEFGFTGIDGPRIFDWRVYPVLSPEGDVSSVFSVSRDVTERKNAEDELRKSEEKFYKIFHASPAPMSISTLSDAKYIDVNDSFLKIMEFRREEILGRSAIDLNTWADEDERDQIVNLLRENGTVRNFEGKYRTKHGRIGTSVLSAEIIVLDGIRCIIGVTLDITERKLAEEALRVSMDELHELTTRLENIREEERKSVSREVHDQVGQILTALQMDLMSLKKSGVKDPKTLEAKVQSMLDLTASATKTVQEISARLRPGMLDDLGLVAAIEWQAEDFEKRSGIVCSKELPDRDIAIDSSASTAIFRIFQETLTNIARHSKANRVSIRLADLEKDIVLSVRDNGIGIEASHINNPKSYGLQGMRERLRPFQGTCTVQKSTDGGTEVVVRLPKFASRTRLS